MSSDAGLQRSPASVAAMVRTPAITRVAALQWRSRCIGRCKTRKNQQSRGLQCCSQVPPKGGRRGAATPRRLPCSLMGRRLGGQSHRGRRRLSGDPMRFGDSVVPALAAAKGGRTTPVRRSAHHPWTKLSTAALAQHVQEKSGAVRPSTSAPCRWYTAVGSSLHDSRQTTAGTSGTIQHVAESWLSWRPSFSRPADCPLYIAAHFGTAEACGEASGVRGSLAVEKPRSGVTMLPVADKTTLVIVGAWNPAILVPKWFSHHVLERQAGDTFPLQVEIDPDSGRPPRLRFQFEDFEVLPAADRITFSPRALNQHTLVSAERAARRLLELLPHTPVGAFGQNFEFIETEPADGQIRQFNAASAFWMSEVDGLRYEQTAAELRTRVVFDQVKQLNVMKQWENGAIRIRFNFHYQTSGSAASALEHLSGDAFSSNCDLARTLAQAAGFSLEGEASSAEVGGEE